MYVPKARVRGTSHMRLRAHDHFQAPSLVEKAKPVKVCFTLRLRDQWSMWMQDGCKVYMNSYMASNGPCFMTIWTIFNHHLSVVMLTQNRETITRQTLTTFDLLYVIMCEDPAWIKKSTKKSIWLIAPSHMASHNTWGPVTHTLWIPEVSQAGLWTRFF